MIALRNAWKYFKVIWKSRGILFYQLICASHFGAIYFSLHFHIVSLLDKVEFKTGYGVVTWVIATRYPVLKVGNVACH